MSLCTVFDSISSNIDKVLLIDPSANVFVFQDCKVHHKDWPTYCGGTDRPGELCYNFSISKTLLRWLTFLLGSQAVILIVLLFWISFFLLMLIFLLQWLSLHWEILIMCLSQFLLTFCQIHNRMPCFNRYLMTILMLIGVVFVIILEMFHGRMFLILVLLLLLVNFVSGFRLELMYISLTENIPHNLHDLQLPVLLP